MQGGATAENAIIPMNLLQTREAHTADYIVTGSWSTKSYKEAARYGQVCLAASSNADKVIDGKTYGAYCWAPEATEWQINPQASYVHVCTN